jgi:hypothetical protein
LLAQDGSAIGLFEKRLYLIQSGRIESGGTQQYASLLGGIHGID